jgi:membrane protease YdiL (CAAX protease family)
MEVKTTRTRQLRDWRMKKIALYIISVIVTVIGAVLIAKGLFSDPIKDSWQLIIGFLILISGIFSILDTYHWKFKEYLSQKMRKAR